MTLWKFFWNTLAVVVIFVLSPIITPILLTMELIRYARRKAS